MMSEWITVTCPRDKCGVEFAVTTGFYAHRLRDHATFSCPNSHPVKVREGARMPIPSWFDKIFGSVV